MGPAAEARPSASGLELVCENCGHGNELNLGGAAEAKDTAAAPVPPATPRTRDQADPKAAPPPGFLEALVPEAGAGRRCVKCAGLLTEDADNCPRCGFSVGIAPYPVGEAPWDSVRPEKKAALDQAVLLWGALEDSADADDLRKFVDFVTGENLLEFGVQRLRFYLVEHPDDGAARESLLDLGTRFQSRVVVAQATAQVGAADFAQKATRARTLILGLNLVAWGSVLLIFAANVFQSC